MKILRLVEDAPNTKITQEEVDKIPEDKEAIENLLLSKRDYENASVWESLIKKYFKIFNINLENYALDFILAKMQENIDAPEIMLKGNSPWFELVKNVAKNNIDLYVEILRLIDKSLKKGDITNLDLKSENSWLLNNKIYNGEDIEGQKYKILLHSFLSNEENLTKYKNNEKLPLKDLKLKNGINLSKWEDAVKFKSDKLKYIYASFTDDDYQEKNKNNIKFKDFIILLEKETSNSDDKWTSKNYIDNIKKKIIQNPNLNIPDSNLIIKQLNDIINCILQRK